MAFKKFDFPREPEIPISNRKANSFSDIELEVPTHEWILATAEDLLDEISLFMKKVRDHISNLAIINSNKHEDITKAISEGWYNPSLIPLSLYEDLSGSAAASHKFLRQLVLDVNRSIVGDNSLDILDLAASLKIEVSEFKDFVENYPDMSSEHRTAFAQYISQVWGAYNSISRIKNDSVASEYYKLLEAIPSPLDQQKQLHSFLLKVNKKVSADKALLSTITTETSSRFFKESIPSKLTPDSFTGDAKLEIHKRADAIQELTGDLVSSISASQNIRAAHQSIAESSEEAVSPESVSAGFTIQEDPAGIVEAGNRAREMTVFNDATTYPGEYFPSLLFTLQDDMSPEQIVDYLNSLPKTHTYLRAGLISVAAEWDFINELISNINNQPSNSTLISGGFISLKGQTLDDWGDNVDTALEELYSQSYATASGIINELNLYNEDGGLLIMVPGLIGLRGDLSGGIRDAIIDSINNPTTGDSLLLGPGVIVVDASGTLQDYSSNWESAWLSVDGSGAIWNAAADMVNLSGDLWNTNASGAQFINYWRLTDTTFIDGSSIGAGTLSADKIVVGLMPLWMATGGVVVAEDSYYEFDLGASYSVQELRMELEWPSGATKLGYKIEISTNNFEDSFWLRGSGLVYATQNRVMAYDPSGELTDVPVILPFLGSQTRYIRLHFNKFYTAEDVYVPGAISVPSGSRFVVFGGAGMWDGGNLFVGSVTVGRLEPDVQNTHFNFNLRNDRNPSTPKTPSVDNDSSVSHVLNTDGSSNIKFSWSF